MLQAKGATTLASSETGIVFGEWREGATRSLLLDQGREGSDVDVSDDHEAATGAVQLYRPTRCMLASRRRRRCTPMGHPVLRLIAQAVARMTFRNRSLQGYGSEDQKAAWCRTLGDTSKVVASCW